MLAPPFQASELGSELQGALLHACLGLWDSRARGLQWSVVGVILSETNLKLTVPSWLLSSWLDYLLISSAKSLAYCVHPILQQCSTKLGKSLNEYMVIHLHTSLPQRLGRARWVIDRLFQDKAEIFDQEISSRVRAMSLDHGDMNDDDLSKWVRLQYVDSEDDSE